MLLNDLVGWLNIGSVSLINCVELETGKCTLAQNFTCAEQAF